jgi:hypothetical protein
LMITESGLERASSLLSYLRRATSAVTALVLHPWWRW